MMTTPKRDRVLSLTMWRLASQLAWQGMFVLSLCFAFTVHAETEPAGADRPFRFPGSPYVLQDGDIVLTKGGDLFNVLNSEFGFPQGRYSHAQVYLADHGTTGKLVGFSRYGIQEFSPALLDANTDYLALVRPRQSPAPGALMAALKILKSRPLRFDYAMRWPEVDSDSTYCAGFLSQLHRMAGAQDPFPPLTSDIVRESKIGHWAKRRLGLDLSVVVSPNRVLSLDGFELLAEHQPANATATTAVILTDRVVKKVRGYIENENMDFKPIEGSKLVLGLLYAGMVQEVELPEFPVKMQGPFASMKAFSEKVGSEVRKRIRTAGEKPWSPQEIESLTDSVADAYRDRYFIHAR